MVDRLVIVHKIRDENGSLFVVVPIRVCRRLGLKAGDKLAWLLNVDTGGIEIKKTKETGHGVIRREDS
jgi:bifunctional DNA-binding transcriptional regulator/antitoxin component of YhaV-PrlF toxin-antitoxin module